MNKKTNLIAIIAVVVVAVVALFAGYTWGNKSGDDSSSTTATNLPLSKVAAKASATEHNASDGKFAMMMTEHHTQAIDMAKLAPSRASSEQVKTLAANIEAAQGPEIEKMTGWMDAWGAVGDSSNMDHMDGEMSASDMKSLENSSGAAFDKMFLQMMIQHHEGAITMANDELKSGKNGDALALAASIAVSQQGEISEMKSLLK